MFLGVGGCCPPLLLPPPPILSLVIIITEIEKMKRNEAKKLKRKEAKNYCFCFAKRSEKGAKRFLFRFVSLRSEKKCKRKWDTLYETPRFCSFLTQGVPAEAVRVAVPGHGVGLRVAGSHNLPIGRVPRQSQSDCRVSLTVLRSRPFLSRTGARAKT